MRRPGWGDTLRGLVLRWLVNVLGVVLVLAVVGFFLGGWAGARNGAIFGLLAGGLALPFLLESVVARRGGGVEEEGHRAFYEQWYGEAFRAGRSSDRRPGDR